VYQSRGASGRFGEIRFNCEVHPYAHGESIFASDRPALWRASGDFSMGRDRSLRPEPINNEQPTEPRVGC
jgi:hypothetical protein